MAARGPVWDRPLPIFRNAPVSRHTGPPGLTVSRSQAGRSVSGPYGMPETVFSFVGAAPRPAHRFGKYVGAHNVRPQAGLGPAPTDIPERSNFFVGAAHWAARPNRVPFPGGPASVRPLRHARNGFLFCRGGSQTRPPFWEMCRGAQRAPAGRSGTGPYRYSGTLPFLRRGGTLGRPA